MKCSQKCRLAKWETQGHGWIDWECMVSHELISEGAECPYANKTINEINEMHKNGKFKW